MQQQKILHLAAGWYGSKTTELRTYRYNSRMTVCDQPQPVLPATWAPLDASQPVPQPRSDFWAVLESAGLWLLVLLAGLALMLTMLLALQRTEAQLLRDARLALVLQEMRESVELELALGLDLADISQTRNLLENALRKDASLLTADVMNTRGLLLFSTDRGSVGETVVSAVIQAAQQQTKIGTSNGAAQQAHWSTPGEDDRSLGLAIRNSFSQTVGYISVTALPVETIRPAGVLWSALGLLGTVALLGWLAAHQASRRDNRAGNTLSLQQAAWVLQEVRQRQEAALARLMADQEQAL